MAAYVDLTAHACRVSETLFDKNPNRGAIIYLLTVHHPFSIFQCVDGDSAPHPRLMELGSRAELFDPDCEILAWIGKPG